MNEAFRARNAVADQECENEDDRLVEITDFYDPIAALLSSIGGEAENLTEELRSYGIKYEHLSGLCDEDLKILGLKNEKNRQEVLAEISCLPNQIEHYDIATRVLDDHGYTKEVLQNISTHLDSLTALLSLTHLRISTSHVNDVQISENKYASEVGLRICHKVNTRTVELENLIADIKLKKFCKLKPKTLKCMSISKMYAMDKVLLPTLLIGTALVGLKFFKLFVK
ncbi:uncharacterized protein LOC131440585 [Malaya genurostris]|uniref:uncharacterized protein LOC131440585 n=1 Tax=Malaya genurostris TaxID=325434 RepID=UPI0026F3CDC2|nr:uncharacterized protein LOC131440585 [Malaya genurostris]